MPDMRSQEIQSFALTTAILVRKIVVQLDINDLKISSEYNSEINAFPLRNILDAFIHFRAFVPETTALSSESTDCVVDLYSDRTAAPKDRFTIKLSNYFDLAAQFAHDDLFVANYLLRRVITLLYQINNANKDFGADYLRTLSDLVQDAFALAIKLEKANEIRIPSDVVVDRYERIRTNPHNVFEGEYVKSLDPLSYADLTKGLDGNWRFSPFTPFRVGLGGIDTYCVPIEKSRDKKTGGLDHFIVSFGSLIDIFKAVKKQFETQQGATPRE